jgi:hypothetical protein
LRLRKMTRFQKVYQENLKEDIEMAAETLYTLIK